MRFLKFAITLLTLLMTFSLFAQKEDLLSELPETKQEFIDSEKNVLATIKWLEETPINEEESRHSEQYALLLAWLTNSPTVTIELNADILTFTKKNSELLLFFMAGWTKFSLENDYAKDLTKGSLAGIRCAIKIYNEGGLKRDKKIEKLIDLDEDGKLESWISSQLGE